MGKNYLQRLEDANTLLPLVSFLMCVYYSFAYVILQLLIFYYHHYFAFTFGC